MINKRFLTIPNFLSLIRLVLVPLFIISILSNSFTVGLIIFSVAGITDFVDGYLARRMKQETPMGKFLDPMADKILLTSAYLMLAIPSLAIHFHIPVWISVLVVTRDFLIVSLSLVIYIAGYKVNFTPTFLSKINTAFQITSIIVVLLANSLPSYEIISHLAVILLYTTALTTLSSGLHYLTFLFRLESQNLR